MKLKVIGSNSNGNGYVLSDSEGKTLVLEAGMSFRKVLKAVGYDRQKIAACVISHRHGDHAKYIGEYMGFPILSVPDPFLPNTMDIEERKTQSFPPFQIYPFHVLHDVPNYGYVVRHKEMGTLLFATDCQTIPIIFKGVDHFLIEANYSASRLLLSDTDDHQKKRIMQSHQSLEDCMEYLHACHAENAKTITLIHLSSRHADADMFARQVETEFGVPCYIARKNTEIIL